MKILASALFATCLSAVSGAQELVIVWTDVSKDSSGREISADLADLMISTIKVAARTEYFPPGRAAAYLSQKNTFACSILAKATIERLSMIPVQEVSREDIVLADFAPPAPGAMDGVGSLNNPLFLQIGEANGFKLHTVPTIQSAAAMVKSGRLTRFLGLNGMIVTMALNNDLQILSTKNYGVASVWLGCAQDTPAAYREAYAASWNELLIGGELEAVYARHNAGGGLLPPRPKKD